MAEDIVDREDNALKKYEEDDDVLDFSEESPGDDVIAGMMSGLIEASNHRTMMAVELTKLVVAKHSQPSMSENDIFSAFKRASKVVSESVPLKELLEKFN